MLAILMTRQRYEQLLNQLNKLRNEDFPRNRRAMKEAMESGGGMHDNASYEHSLQDERLLLRRVAELESIVSAAQIITTPYSTNTVRVGHRIRARDVKSEEPYDIIIGGYMDTNLDKNWCSYQAPLAASFIGKQVGDFVRFVSPAGEERLWEILEIEIANLEKECSDET